MSWGDKLLNNFWPKVIALVLAVATWFYVFDMVNTDSFSQKKETVADAMHRLDFTDKEVSVEAVFTGKSPSGYRVLFNKVKVDPSRISIFGPKVVLKDIDDLRTDKVDLGEYTRSVKLTLGLHSDSRILQLKDKTVDVYIPIEKVPVGNGKPKEK
ncbi:MAG: YbbR-like domain-containing protein [Candidatus Omnitrophica bacterium]|nr:YbbR-like domain-containing protein [Candidatus Omnitrophota bacterium]